MNLGNEVPNNPLEIVENELELSSEIPILKNHPIDYVLGDLNKGIQTRALQNIVSHMAFLS